MSWVKSMFGTDIMLSYKINKAFSLNTVAAGVSLAFCLLITPNVGFAQESEINAGDQTEYRLPGPEESEFNNYSNSFVRDWRDADPEHEDTEFGELMYNEASTPTKLEILRLLSKDTPSMVVIMHAVAMGIDIDEVLRASVNYEPKKSSNLAASAANILPILPQQEAETTYPGYELEDLEREDESQPYLVQEVIDKFFEQRQVLRPYPDWFDGQYHFMASAAELFELQQPNKDLRWYRTKSTVEVSKRPIFVSLYEATQAVLVDGEERIKEALAQDPNALLPVVFVFNQLNERSIDQLGYPATIRGAQNAYADKSLMLTPVPEWQLGEYHMYAQVEEFYEIFEIPEEEDFEPEAWQKLLEEAEDYSVTNTSFLMVILGGGDRKEEDDQNSDKSKARTNVSASLSDFNRTLTGGLQVAAWDDPRTESDYKYAPPRSSKPVTLKNIVGKGVIFNRPDLLAALSTLGVTKVPVSYYYIDNTRVRPFTRGAKALLNFAQGTTINPSVPGGGASRQ